MANRWIADLVGTFKSTFQLGKGGPKVKGNAGVVEARNAADSAYANMVVAALTAAGINVQADDLVINSNAAGSGADWTVTLSRPATGMTHALQFILPSGDPATGQALTVASFAGDVITMEWTTVAGGTDKVVVDTTNVAFGSSSPIAMFTKPANAVTQSVKVVVDTAFNGTAPTLSIGISGTTSKYMGATDIDLKTVGVYEVDPGLVAEVGTEALIATYAPDSSSQGAARILYEYVIPS